MVFGNIPFLTCIFSATLYRFSARAADFLQYQYIFCNTCRVFATLCRFFCRSIAENLQSVMIFRFRFRFSVPENLQVLQKICRYIRKCTETAAGDTGSVQKIRRYYRKSAECCKVLQKVYRYCRKSEGVAE